MLAVVLIVVGGGNCVCKLEQGDDVGLQDSCRIVARHQAGCGAQGVQVCMQQCCRSGLLVLLISQTAAAAACAVSSAGYMFVLVIVLVLLHPL